ncbi:hypothetical protein MYMA111404_00165 [Mycoplasma marinum]|uniref:Uncharacterized protein n=1 Tax=Mycoplasma marinum TaxID=1937190 RepID=A0A4R0XLY3_9MOLU|nr:hypothetical protein [Mycoplasma marinum]TCG11716.1 hypothetical protein C4B24_01010 [Mycoplasma marinum]
MKIKYKQENFTLSNLTIKEASKKIKKKIKTSEYWKWISEKHEINYIINFLGPLLLDDENKKFFKNVTIYDLFNIYYIDFIIKNDLLVMCQKIERYLKVSMLEEIPSIFLKEKSKTLGSKVEFYSKKHLDDSQRYKIMNHFVKIVNTDFKTVKDFQNFLKSVKRIRNFCAHGFNKAKYYNWNSDYSQGTYRSVGKYYFKYDLLQLLNGSTRGSVLDFKENLIDIFENRPFSTNELNVLICKRYIGSNTPYSFDWNKYSNKKTDKFSLNKFLQANSPYKKIKNTTDFSEL